MRNRLLIWLLFFSLFGWGQVPDTNTFTLDSVVKVVNPATNDLSACFSAAVKTNFDPLYDSIGYAPVNSLLRFRNYQASEAPCDNYGLLYNWHAVNTGKLAPTGWHVPSGAEWEALRIYVADQGWNYDGTMDQGTYNTNKQGKALASICNWTNSSNVGAVGNTDYPDKRNISGFYAIPGGVRSGYDGSYMDINRNGCWWSSTINQYYPAYYADYADMFFSVTAFRTPGTGGTRNIFRQGYSVRCIRDTSVGWEAGEKMVDYDGNKYDTVKIGTQIWAIQNLKTTHYNDGVAIPNVTDPSAWATLTTGACCAYNNDWVTYVK